MWIFLYAALGIWFGGFTGLLYYRFWQLIFRLWPHSLAGLQSVFMIVTSGIFLAGLLRVSGMRPRHALHFWRYPPLWTSLLLIGTAIAVWLLICPSVLAVESTTLWTIYVCV